MTLPVRLEQRVYISPVTAAETVTAFLDPHSIRVAMGQQQAQIAELMAEAHAAGDGSGVRRIAAEKMNAALIEAAKDAQSRPLTMGDGESVDVLSLTRGETVGGDVLGAPSDDEDSADFLSRMNDLSRHV